MPYLAMPSLRLIAALSAFIITPLAFAQSQNDETRVWAVVAYVHHGDSVPELSSRPAVLIPEGAQQMVRQGTAFRARYLNETSSSAGNSTSDSSKLAPIYGMEQAALDNSQLTVMAAEDEASAGSALAFLQGLYPPVTQKYSTLAGGNEIAQNFASNSSTLVDYPLDGYQYPKLQIPSSSDKNSPSIQGTLGCTKWTSETNSTLRKRSDMKELYDESAAFYKDLFASGALKDAAVPNESANFWNAYEIYDYVNYLYLHNEIIHEQLSSANDTLARLKAYAYAIQRGKNTEWSDETDNTKTQLYTVAGRTLASKIVRQLDGVIANRASRNKLTLMFGSLEPMLSFFSISGLLIRENKSKAIYNLPQPGSAMIFELIGDVPRKYETNLDPEKLQVRFYYRPSADDGENFENYALFNSGYGGTTVSYTTFSRQLSKVSMNSTDWCEVCGATTSPWCGQSSSSDETDSSGMFTRKQSMHPAIAGVIGALVMAAVLGLIALALYMLAGLRLRRAGGEERKRSFGGFKREEKKSSDADVSVTQEGTHHERVGSWELRGHESPINGLGGVVTKNFSRSVIRKADDDDDQISILGAKPTAVREAL